MTATAPEILLTEDEKAICSYLLAVTAWANRKDLTLRIAGGWVRDKVCLPVLVEVSCVVR